jgi:hypothetical protein
VRDEHPQKQSLVSKEIVLDKVTVTRDEQKKKHREPIETTEFGK